MRQALAKTIEPMRRWPRYFLLVALLRAAVAAADEQEQQVHACQQRGCILASPKFKDMSACRALQAEEQVRGYMKDHALKSVCSLPAKSPSSRYHARLQGIAGPMLQTLQLAMPSRRAVLEKLSLRCSNVQGSDLGAACQHGLAF